MIKRRVLVIFLLCCMIATLFNTSTAIDSSSLENAELRQVAKVSVGMGANHVLIDNSGDASEPLGPQAFVVDEKNDVVYILDSAQSNILAIKGKTEISSIAIPFSLYPRDILLYNREFYILDSNAVIYRTDLLGNLLEVYTLPKGLGSLSVYKMNVQSGKVVLWLENYNEIDL